MTRYLSIFFSLLLLTSCQLEEMWDDVKDESKETFTIEEAREFFEELPFDKQQEIYNYLSNLQHLIKLGLIIN